jgi:hypothetical protein
MRKKGVYRSFAMPFRAEPDWRCEPMRMLCQFKQMSNCVGLTLNPNSQLNVSPIAPKQPPGVRGVADFEQSQRFQMRALQVSCLWTLRPRGA